MKNWLILSSGIGAMIIASSYVGLGSSAAGINCELPGKSKSLATPAGRTGAVWAKLGATAPGHVSPVRGYANSYFFISGTRIQKINDLTIFNRKGHAIWVRHNLQPGNAVQGWDGTANGRQLPADTYIFSATVVSNAGETVKICGFTRLH
ncbi:MAG: hypothetical protein EBZ77_15980 [Chitinophagia bacterium]|nr:hypothetical protein [Chitinophagia bacterium]